MTPDRNARLEARAAGLMTYSTGDPCRNGHVADRYVSTAGCCACVREKSKARIRAKRAQNADAERGRDRAWRAANAAKERARKKAWREANHAALIQRDIQWRLKNPEQMRVQDFVRRAREKQASGSHTAADIREIFSAQKKKCAYCRSCIKRHYHADHIKPLSKGGSNDKRNLQLLCAPCNLSKGAKLPHAFAQEKGLLL